MNLVYNSEVKIYIKEIIDNSGFTESQDVLKGHYKGRLIYNSRSKKITQNGNLQEVVISSIIAVKKTFNRDFLKSLKHEGYIEVDNEKFRLVDFKTSGVMKTTYFYGIEDE